VKSSVLKRSIVVAGHKTSVSLEDEFWKSLKEIAADRDMTLAQLVATIDGNREHANLSSAIRDFLCLASIAISVAEASGGTRGDAGRPPL
jgi:predicted DNA-binding ribbon-helix-helix protein